MADISADINALVKPKKTDIQLPVAPKKNAIQSVRSQQAEDLDIQVQRDGEFLVKVYLSAQTIRLYKNNDPTSANWVDTSRAERIERYDSDGALIETEIFEYIGPEA